MKIIFVSLYSPISYLGGAEILTLVLAQSLVGLGHRVTIYTAGIGFRRQVRGVTIQETPFFLFPLRFRTTLLPLYSWILGMIFYLNPAFRGADIVHAIDSGAIVLLSGWKFLQNKFVATIQDYSLVWPTKDYFSLGRQKRKPASFADVLARKIRKRVSLNAVRRLRHAVCVSNYVARKFQQVNSETNITVIGNCVPPDWKKQAVTATRDIDILYVGKLMPYKGLDILLSSLKFLSRLRVLTVMIVGEGLTNRYKNQVMRSGVSHHITFTGPIPYRDIPRFYQRSKIVVSPSIWPEPCGRSIIEAMWLGCAVVATNVGGTPESLIDGVHGYLVSPQRPSEIADACRKLLQNTKKRDEFGESAARFALRNYSSDRIANEYLRFYSLIKSNQLVI